MNLGSVVLDKLPNFSFKAKQKEERKTADMQVRKEESTRGARLSYFFVFLISVCTVDTCSRILEVLVDLAE
jgi:hypothetical protein